MFAYAKVEHNWPFSLYTILIFFFAENDTLSRIGTSCLQQLLEKNVKKLSTARWERIATTFVKLFRTTTPYQLFDESLRIELDGSANDSPDTNGKYSHPPTVSLVDEIFTIQSQRMERSLCLHC